RGTGFPPRPAAHRLTAEALAEYITTYIVLTMRRGSPHPYGRLDQLGAERQRNGADTGRG
ncbi:MAG TPA: hypothetical protein VEH31_23095, partial [Streptosporangiaceae bacterium]|nr:hypothetical protein [Streptosporangiaceae bacterium]